MTWLLVTLPAPVVGVDALAGEKGVPDIAPADGSQVIRGTGVVKF
jgi:hypothetical protein